MKGLIADIDGDSTAYEAWAEGPGRNEHELLNLNISCRRTNRLGNGRGMFASESGVVKDHFYKIRCTRHNSANCIIYYKVATAEADKRATCHTCL
jgi:hypothetical protein